VTEKEAALLLAGARGIGPRAAEALRSRFGSFRRAVERASSDPGVPARFRRAISERGTCLADEMRELAGYGIRFVERGAEEYPEALDATHGPPVGLFVEGTIPRRGLAVAIVGSRRGSERALSVARTLGRDLAMRRVTVVSGLARGVDSAAHRGALEGGGTTVAVLGSGLRRIYPPENRELARSIAATGCVLSEFSPRVEARPSSFPRRNRVIAGLSAAVVVVEAGEKSGALITASYALEEGREVLACPGPVGGALCRGSNRLIREGARLVESAADILEDLEPIWGPELLQAEDAASGDRAATTVSSCASEALGALSLEPVDAERVAEETGRPIGVVLAALMELELAGEARRTAGGGFVVSDAVARRRGIGTARGGR